MKEYKVLQEFSAVDIANREDVSRKTERDIARFVIDIPNMHLTDIICNDGAEPFDLNLFDRSFNGTNGLEWLIDQGYIEEVVPDNIVRMCDMEPGQTGVIVGWDLWPKLNDNDVTCVNIKGERVVIGSKTIFPWYIENGDGYKMEVRLCELDIREKVEGEIVIKGDGIECKGECGGCGLDKNGHCTASHYTYTHIATPKE